MAHALVKSPELASPAWRQWGCQMNLHARFRVVLSCELLRDSRSLVFAVVVYYDEGKFARIVLLKQRAGRFADGGGFIAGWNDGDYAGPARWGGMFGAVIVERGQVPEHAAAKREIKPDAERGRGQESGRRDHGLFCNGREVCRKLVISPG